jgi:ComF family protein
LCHARAHGGALCALCVDELTDGMRSAAQRCAVCCLALDSHGICPDCAQHAPAFDRIVAAFDYAGSGELLIHYLKAQRRFVLADPLASFLQQAVRRAMPDLPSNAIVACVPASRASIVRRGFNPAGEVARRLAKRLDLQHRPGLICRTHDGVKQARLTRRERVRSVRQLYRCTQRLDGRVVAVVDDVMTTGSTLDSIAHELKASGAVAVYGFVLARTPYR